MNKLRYGIIGIGNMGSTHCKILLSGTVKNATLAAVHDIDPVKINWAKENLPSTVRICDKLEDFWSSDIDAVIVAVPHYDHASLAIEGFKRGLHVLVEKPAGVYTKQVQEMNDEALKSGLIFGIMYNQRTNPVYQKVKQLVVEGELGDLKRVIWIVTNWYRSQSYYNSGGWRATWAGEGGGVLLNQDPHQLDLWQWICGMPTSIYSFMEFGKNRDIEVENDVTAYAKYANGATGLFVTSTHEAPGTNRLELSGTKGKIVLEDDTITFWRNEIDEVTFNKNYQGGFGQPDVWKCEIPVPTDGGKQHAGILENFADSVLNNTPLLAPGIEGIRGLSISNAMHLSAWTNSWINPEQLDEDLFYKILQEKIAASTYKKEISAKTLDTSGTY